MESLSLDRRPELRKPDLDLLLQGLERRRRVGLLGAAVPGDASGTPSDFGAIDPEEFFDFQVTRPTVTLTEGLTRKIEWPEFVLLERRGPGGATGMSCSCSAPSRTCAGGLSAETIVRAARELGVELVVSLGALLADVPHTRPVQITGIAGDADLAERLGFSQTRYEGPTGIVGVLHDACARAGIDSASLWAPVPHYVARCRAQGVARADPAGGDGCWI